MPGKYKLLVVDIDGTLLDKRGIISKEDTDGLSRARAAGITVSLSTGRAVKACTKILEQLSLDGYHIFFDGALVCNPHTWVEVYSDPINKDIVRELAEYLRENPLNMDFYSPSTYYIERETWATEIRRTFYGLQPVVTDFMSLWQTEKIIKGTLVVRSPEEKAQAQECYKLFGDRLTFSWSNTPAYPGVDFINILTRNVSKGTALKALVEFLKVPMDEVVAMGDGTNDIPLLEAAGLGIAMDNASENVKAVADYVTLDVDHSGVAAAIDKYLIKSS